MSDTDNRTIDETLIETVVERVAGGKQNVILDATILSTLMSCPRLADFRFNHNLHAVGGKSNSLEVGSIIHKFLEIYYGCIIDRMSREQAYGHAMTAAQLYIAGCKYCTDFQPTPEIPKPLCGHKAGDYPGVHNTPKDSEGYKTGWQWALQTCEQYLEHYRNDHWVPLETEVVKSKVLFEDDEIRILWKAKLDLVTDTNQGVYPCDHKSMKQRRDTISMNNQFIGQCHIMGTRGVYINKIGLQTSLKAAEKFERKIVPYSEARLMEWQSETLPYYAKLLLMYAETGHFPPNFSNCESKYGNCAFLKVCESNPDDRERVIKLHFVVGPEWNPTNDED